MAKAKGIWWNVWADTHDQANGSQRIAERVAQLVEEHNPDWICLQEVYSYTPFDHDVFAKVQAKIGWQGYFTETVRHHSSLEGKAGLFTEGIATFSRWPMEPSDSFLLGTSTTKKGTVSRKYLLETRLQINDSPLVVGNTHWTHMKHTNIPSRKTQMVSFLERVRSLSSETPYIVGGDFNTFSFHPVIRKLRKHLDLHTGTWAKPTWMHRAGTKTPIRSNIDYVGVPHGGKTHVQSVTVLARKPSDHAPLLVEVTY